jgi:hypothetical protein
MKIIVIIFCLVLVLSACAPEKYANADVIRTMAPQATAAAIEHQEAIYHATATALSNAQAEDAMALERKRIQDAQTLANEMLKESQAAQLYRERQQFVYSATNWAFGAFIAALIVFFISIGAATGATAAAKTAQQIQIAKLPVSVTLPNDLLLIGGHGQAPLLIDTITGASSPLSDKAGVSVLREQYRERMGIADRMAAAAENIARTSKSDQPADWLPGIVSALPENK